MDLLWSINRRQRRNDFDFKWDGKYDGLEWCDGNSNRGGFDVGSEWDDCSEYRYILERKHRSVEHWYWCSFLRPRRSDHDYSGLWKQWKWW